MAETGNLPIPIGGTAYLASSIAEACPVLPLFENRE